MLVVVSLAGAASPVAATAATPTETPSGTPAVHVSAAQAASNNTTTANASTPTTTVSLTTTTGGNGTGADTPEGPTDASQVRITPAVPDADYVEVTTVESDAVYNTSGTFATIALSRPVDAVRVPEPGAEASLVGSGDVVRVEYADDAAPRDTTTLYSLELYFPDGSEKTVDLYATDTAVSAETQIDPSYLSFIEYVEEQAADAGYETTPDGLTDYVQFKEERAQLLRGLWTEQIETFIALRMAQMFSPLDWVAGIAIIAMLSLYASRKHGWVLRAQQIATSKAELVREAVRQEYEEQRNAAAKHPLEDVDGIGRNDARYWRNVGIETVDDIVQVACKGIVAVDEAGHIERDDEGRDIFEHHGVDDLAAVEPLTEKSIREKTWLKPLLVEGRLRATTALSNIERALLTAEREYNRGNEVRETRMQVQELLAELRGERDHTDAKASTYGPREIQTGDVSRLPDHDDDDGPDSDPGPGSGPGSGSGSGTGVGPGTPAGGDD